MASGLSACWPGPWSFCPADYAFRYDLTGEPNLTHNSTGNVSIEAAFTAVSIGYGVVPKVQPIKFGIAPRSVLAAASLSSLSATAPVAAQLQTTTFGLMLRALGEALDEDDKITRGELGPRTATVLEDGFKLNPEFAERVLLGGAMGSFDEQILAETFQSVAAPPSPALRSLRVRLVHGEILRDDQGNYYERIADRIRPLQRLASGPRGEIVDINPVVEARSPGESTPGNPAPSNGRAAEPERVIEERGDLASGPRDKSPVDPVGAALPAWQKLLPEPGSWRVVAFGEFKISREEASYDMKQTSPWSGRFAAFVSRHWSRADFRRWQTLLQGKNLDDQLWGIRLPKGAWQDPLIRDWARQTLELAGYDPGPMLREWEVFWRRKGLS